MIENRSLFHTNNTSRLYLFQFLLFLSLSSSSSSLFDSFVCFTGEGEKEKRINSCPIVLLLVVEIDFVIRVYGCYGNWVFRLKILGWFKHIRIGRTKNRGGGLYVAEKGLIG